MTTPYPGAPVPGALPSHEDAGSETLRAPFGPVTPPVASHPTGPQAVAPTQWGPTPTPPVAPPAPLAAPPPSYQAPAYYPPPPAATPPPPGTPTAAEQEAARAALIRLRTEVGKAVIGQDAAVSGLVVALLCRGHALLEGVPGVAKTLLVRTLARALTLETKRLQFTPDLMPGDVTGSLFYDTKTGEFGFRPGPVFTNLLLADEINRTPPKTQAALLEVMEERQVSIDGTPRPLPSPFAVLATQNPVEHEGTYPLPEAQLDRFLVKVTLPMPPRDDEIKVLAHHAAGFDPSDLDAAGVSAVAGPTELAVARAGARAVQVRPEVLAYIVDVARATRSQPSVLLGVSPRGATALLATSKAWAWLSGRSYATPDDVKALARATLRHRISLRPEAELDGVTGDRVLEQVLATVPVPR
ncbi:MoxR family ATPase [Frankia sp. AgB1.9]|uniref:AAA family ATPase n=1 Tax=unclassified Frankia TaxID=2632575 RepID=UPI00193271A9|nr:MoxR family ATPase [Frankia sp. AgB1.9]MBL7619053.1 MoxR family ATPase [Frankia sp. AgB1.8]